MEVWQFFYNYFQLHSEMEQITIQFCPVISPTLKEFLNFRQFVEKLDKKYKKNYGMVKIVPPKGWIPRQANYKTNLQNLIVQGPIQQNIFGKGGIYECLHIPKKSMTLDQYKLKAQELDKITDGLSGQQVQKMFWKNIAFSPPLYGADLLNTLMDSRSLGWDLNNLDSILRDALSQNVRGVNNPYCYVGSWKALFCWHTQDLDLSAINFLHLGKPKFWYAIHHEDRHYLQKEAQRIFPQHFSSCSQFLRHKTTLINPYHMKKKYPQIRIQKAMQQQNEFILVLGGSYHCGFNFGYNIAEAVNYATLDWLRQLPLVKSCKCSSKSVKASEYQIYKNLAKIPLVANTQQFKQYQEYIYKKAEQQQSQEQFQVAKKGVKEQFTKKIKKLKKAPRKITYNNEEYQVQNWAQCEKCNVWRVVEHPLKVKEQFYCKKAGKECFKKQKVDKKVFTISTGTTQICC